MFNSLIVLPNECPVAKVRYRKRLKDRQNFGIDPKPKSQRTRQKRCSKYMSLQALLDRVRSLNLNSAPIRDLLRNHVALCSVCGSHHGVHK